MRDVDDRTQTGLDDAARARIVAGVLTAMFMAALDQTIVAPVIPTLGAALGDAQYISWIVSAYFLTSTAVTPLYGKIADIHGRRWTLLAAMAIFVLGSVVCALAPSMLVLILGRAVQGLGGGGLVAVAQTVIGDLYPPRERGKMAGYFALMWGTASVAGPIVGGLIAERYHWSLIFWLNLPLTAFAALMTNDTLKRLAWARREHRLDIVGSGLVVLATVLVMLALALAPQERFGWRSPIVLALLAGGLALVPVVLAHLRRAAEPLIPLEVLRNPVVLLATSSVFFGMAANIAMSVFVPLYLELALGRSSGRAGIALVAYMMGSVIAANLAGRSMLTVVNYKRLPVLGLILAAATTATIAARVGRAGITEFEVLLFFAGAGVGFQFPVTTTAVQNAVDPRDIGVASGINAFMRSLGSSLGIAVAGAVGAAAGIAIEAAEGASRTAAVANAAMAASFRPVFLSVSVMLVFALVCLVRMPQLPLRGRTVAR